MVQYKIYNEDCINVLRSIEDKSVNLVLTDPPYNIKKAPWDDVPDYINWCGRWILECQRILKDNGVFYFFHNNLPLIAELMEFIRLNTDFKFNSFCVWDKPNCRKFIWKHLRDNNTLRSWFPTCEYCLMYVKPHSEEFRRHHFKAMREYFKKVKNYMGKSITHIRDQGFRSTHFFDCSGVYWRLPSLETYDKLISSYHIDKMPGFKSYQELMKTYEIEKAEYKKERDKLRYTHNLDAEHNNVWREAAPSNNVRLHPTQKPVTVLERIIKVSSNAGDTVLDPFMGSGSTGVACGNTGRHFIGIEKEKNYFKIAESCINKAFFA